MTGGLNIHVILINPQITLSNLKAAPGKIYIFFGLNYDKTADDWPQKCTSDVWRKLFLDICRTHLLFFGGGGIEDLKWNKRNLLLVKMHSHIRFTDLLCLQKQTNRKKIQGLSTTLSKFYRGCAEKPRGQGSMCWWIMGLHCACCCWQALLVGRMSL